MVFRRFARNYGLLFINYHLLPQLNMLRRLLPFLILFIGLANFSILKTTRPTPTPVIPQERIWGVTVVEITPADHRPVLSLFGRVESPDRVCAGCWLDPRDLEPRLRKVQDDVEKEHLCLVHDTGAQERELVRLAEVAVNRVEAVQGRWCIKIKGQSGRIPPVR